VVEEKIKPRHEPDRVRRFERARPSRPRSAEPGVGGYGVARPSDAPRFRSGDMWPLSNAKSGEVVGVIVTRGGRRRKLKVKLGST